MASTQTYKDGVVTRSSVTEDIYPVSTISVKFDDGSTASFRNQDESQFKNYPVGKRVKAVFNDGEPGGVQGFNY